MNLEERAMSSNKRNPRRAHLLSERRRAARPKRNLIRASGLEALEARALMTISNVTLVNMAPPLNPVEGQLFKSLGGVPNDSKAIATFIDDNTSPSFSGFLSWGDGNFSQEPGDLLFIPDSVVKGIEGNPGAAVPNQWDVFSAAGHTYLEESTSPLFMYFTVADNSTTNPGSGFAFNPSLIVSDAPLTAGPSIPINPVEGQQFTGTVATFTDADPNTNSTEYAAVINWGDGATSSGTVSGLGPNGTGPYVVAGTHTYSEEGTYPSFDSKGNQINPPVSVLITDTDGHTPPQGTRATTTVTDSATVHDAPLSNAVPQTPFSAVESNDSSGVVATFLDTDTGANLSKEAYTGTINWGDNTSTTFNNSNLVLVSSSSAGTVFNIFGTHNYAEEGTKAISVTVTDDGGQSTTVTNTANVADAPISVVGANFAAVEGSNKSFTVGTITDNNPNATSSDFANANGMIFWGDGSAPTPLNAPNVTITPAGKTTTQSFWTITASHAYLEDGIYTNTNTDPTKPPTIGIRVVDVGGASSTAASTATVQDAPLVAGTITVPAQTENNGFTNLAVATFEDQDPNGVPGDYNATIVWGDGSAPTTGTVQAHGIDPATGFASFTVLGTHAPYSDGKNYGYGEEGTYSVSVLITDTDGHLPTTPAVARSSTVATSTVTVNDAPLTANPFTPTNPSAGIPLPSTTVVGAFHDTDPGNPGDPTTIPGDYSATINWGDGHTSSTTSVPPLSIVYSGTTGDFLVEGSNTYAQLGTYNVTVTIVDHGTPLVEQYTVNVTLPPPIVTGVPVGATEGTSFSGIVATFVNPNGNYTGGYFAGINWGDGTSSAATSIVPDPSPGRFDVIGTHTYGEAGIYTVSTQVTETATGGGSGTATSTATVQDAPLVASPVTFTGAEKSPLTGVVIGKFTDKDPGGLASDYSVTINWNDATPLDTTTGQVVLDPASPPFGTGPQIFDVLGSHTYVEEGTYAPVIINVTENDLGPKPPVTPASTSIQSIAAIADAPLNPATNPYAGGLTTTEGQAFANTFPSSLNPFPGAGAVIATFTDSAPEWPATNDYGALIQWNGPVTGAPASPGMVVADPTTPGLFDVLGNASYTEAGLYHPTVTIADIGGSSLMLDGGTGPGHGPQPSLSVMDAKLVASASTSLVSTEGSIFTGTVASFYDNDPNGVSSDYQVTILWGDGGTSNGTVVPSAPHGPGQPGFTVLGTHTYAEQGPYNIGILIQENDLPTPPPGGFAFTATTAAITVNDAPLSPLPFSPQLPSAVEGQSYTAPVTLAVFTDADPAGVVTDYKATVDWGDGSGLDTTAQVVQVTDSKGNPIPGQFAVQGNHVFAEDGTNTVKVTIYDTDGGAISPPSPFQASTVVSDFVTVSDAPLGVGPATPISPLLEAGSASLITVGTFYDTDPGGKIGDYTVTISWGDGSVSNATLSPAGTLPGTNDPLFLVQGTHGYGEENPRLTTTPPGTGYQITVQVTDTDQHLSTTPAVPRSSVSFNNSVVVKDAPLSLINNTPSSVGANGSLVQTITLAQFSDPDTAEVTSDYTGVVTWSDGATSTVSFAQVLDSKNNPIPGQFFLKDSRIFGSTGNLTATWTIYDTDGIRPITDPISATLPGSTLVAIKDASLISIGNPATVSATEGQSTGNIVLGTFQYGNPAAPASNFTATINWGDGTTSTGAVQPSLPAGNFNVVASHAYLEEGTYTPQVTLVSAGGSVANSSNTTISVADAALTPETGSAFQITLLGHTNVPLTNVIAGTFIDADPNGGNPTVGPQPDYIATIFWGDGSSSTATGFNQVSSSPAGAIVNLLGTHTYTAVGSYFIFAQVFDVDGGTSTTGRPSTFTFNVKASIDNFSSGVLGSSSPAGVGSTSSTAIGTVPSSSSSTKSSTSSQVAAVDAALSSVANDSVVVPSGIIALTDVGIDGSTPQGTKKTSLLSDV
jgi:hypothetical protein